MTMQLEKMSSMEQETDVEHLSVKLKKMKKLLPKLSDTQRSFNLPSHSPRSTIWTDTATGWVNVVRLRPAISSLCTPSPKPEDSTRLKSMRLMRTQS